MNGRRAVSNEIVLKKIDLYGTHEKQYLMYCTWIKLVPVLIVTMFYKKKQHIIEFKFNLTRQIPFFFIVFSIEEN